MNFSAGISLFLNLVLKRLGSVFGCHTDSLIRIYNTICFSNLATMILVQCDFLKYITHILGMELMFNEYPGSIPDSNI